MVSRWFLAVSVVLVTLAPLAASALAQNSPKSRGSAPATGNAKPAAASTETKPADAPVERLGEVQGWSAFAETTKSGKLCYLSGKPTKSEPATLKRGDAYAYVTHRPAEKSLNVVSFAAGYPFKEGSDVELTIDGRKFSLFTSKDTAWARDAAAEKAIVEAMAKGKQAMVKGSSARGTATTDTYSLAGFAQVLGAIDKACGVKR